MSLTGPVESTSSNLQWYELLLKAYTFSLVLNEIGRHNVIENTKITI